MSHDILSGMHQWIKRIHMYLGLLNFVALTVFGIAGLTATMQAGRDGPPPVSGTRYQPFPVPANASDKEVADAVFQAVKLPLSNPIPKQAVRRNEKNELALHFFTLNGPYTVTVLERESRLRIEPMPNSVPRFLSNMHS